MLCVMSLLASGCASRAIDECLVFAPIYLEAEDVPVISDGLARQLLGHNRAGEVVCGW